MVQPHPVERFLFGWLCARRAIWGHTVIKYFWRTSGKDRWVCFERWLHRHDCWIDNSIPGHWFARSHVSAMWPQKMLISSHIMGKSQWPPLEIRPPVKACDWGKSCSGDQFSEGAWNLMKYITCIWGVGHWSRSCSTFLTCSWQCFFLFWISHTIHITSISQVGPGYISHVLEAWGINLGHHLYPMFLLECSFPPHHHAWCIGWWGWTSTWNFPVYQFIIYVQKSREGHRHDYLHIV